MFKIKKRTIAFMILSVAILIAGLISCYYIFPLGYSRDAIYARKDYEENMVNFHLALQFDEQNPSNMILERVSFTEGNSNYELNISSSLNFEVYQDDVQVGAFIKPKKNLIYHTLHMYALVFYQDGSLYYLLRTSITRMVPFVHNGYGYAKYTAYAFNLQNGENTSVSLESFFEKIEIVDPKIDYLGG